ncbi:SPOR domain-containing protein [Kineosporia succinea]|uniref:Sporulation related protein n=1 Tax=Kineosporia succinea TaxID=84632 RepID=A0ABT9P687_9ACTN|nr:SPOR domain-containing protein [Kineosporia succinea]MDP9828177.1 hypothetical protein [Kineosporia succinea]
MSDGAEQYWFNLSTNQVEAGDRKGQGKDVLGPYPTREAAQQALDTARSKTEAWDEEDRRWDDKD